MTFEFLKSEGEGQAGREVLISYTWAVHLEMLIAKIFNLPRPLDMYALI